MTSVVSPPDDGTEPPSLDPAEEQEQLNNDDTPDEPHDQGEENDDDTPEDAQAHSDRNHGTELKPTASFSLGSLLEIKLSVICSTSGTKFLTAGSNVGLQMNARGRLILTGGDSQRAVANAFVKPTTHCKDQTCVLLHDGEGGPIVMLFELTPDVLVNENPQLSIEIRSKGSQKWRGSLWLALPHLLKRLGVGVDLQHSCRLLDDDECLCGQIIANFRCGLQSDLVMENNCWGTVMHEPEGCVLTLTVINLIAEGWKGNDIACVAKVWSSVAGKSPAQTISPLVWSSTLKLDEAPTVSFKVMDTATEILFVGIYRFSAHERNELLGIGSFRIPEALLTAGHDNAQFSSLEQHISLFPQRLRQDVKCGSMVLALRAVPCDEELKAEENPSLAATTLGGIAYPSQRGEMRCRFDIDILKARYLPSNISEGDTIMMHLMVPQSNWKAELTAKAVGDGVGGTIAEVGDKTRAVIRWCLKDRSFPTLEIALYTQPQKQMKRANAASKVSLLSGKNTARRLISRTNQQTNGTATPTLFATGCLHLSSFFLQLETWVSVDMQLAFNPSSGQPEDTFADSRVQLNLRASANVDSPSTPVVDLRPPLQPVKGDICLHLLQVSGNAFRKSDCLTAYYVSLSLGQETATSRHREIGEGQTVTWNEHLTLPVECVTAPIIYITIFQKAIKPSSTIKEENDSPPQQTSEDQVVGYLTVPMFPSVLNDSHLLQLELPFGNMCGLIDIVMGKKRKEPYYYKRGIFTFEMQFLPNQQANATSNAQNEQLELVIHQVRGNLQSSSPETDSSSGLAKPVFIEISLMTDRSGTSENLAVGTTGIISLSASGKTDVGEIIDFSNPTVAAILSENRNSVLVGKVRDLSGNYYGRIHVPLRSGWMERLVRRKKQGWYSICTDSKSDGVKATKDALLLSLRVQEQQNQVPPMNVQGTFYVSISEAVLEHSTSLESSNMLKLGKYGGANVELTASDNEFRFRTRQSTNHNDNQRWQWEEEVFPVVNTSGSRSLQNLQVSLHIGAQSKLPLVGTLDLLSRAEDATLKRLDHWLILKIQEEYDDTNMKAYLHVVITYVPTFAGSICMEFGESHLFSESQRRLRIETSFFKCVANGRTYSTNVSPSCSSDLQQCGKQLRLPVNSRLDEKATALPEFSIQWVGVAKTLGEICFGVFTFDILWAAERCSLHPSNGTESSRKTFTWCEFMDKRDRTRTAGITSIQLGFDRAQDPVTIQDSIGLSTTSSRVASAETFAIWKKLFYLLDENGNGVIDRNEFMDVFLHHVEEMTETSDGQKLLHLLFAENNDNCEQMSKTTPTPGQVSVLFSSIDTNCDGEIEWTEYLRFLQQRQQQMYVTASNSKENGLHVEEIPEQVKELRRKQREDPCRRETSQDSNQTEVQNQPTVATPVTLKKSYGNQELLTYPHENLLKLHHSAQEQIRLHQQVASLESLLSIERKRYAELAADRQALMRSYQQLHLKHQNDLIQEQTKAKWMKQTIERQQQQLEEREATRLKHNNASIVLQSTVRSKLEQKRYHGLKLHRANAAITIQCMVRRLKAMKKLRVLKQLDAIAKQQSRAASALQRFIRYHVHRKEQVLLQEACAVSATILQKNARRLLASSTWQQQKLAILRLQCWIRQRLAFRQVSQVRDATAALKGTLLGWALRWHYNRLRQRSLKLQRWWRRASKQRSTFIEQLEAVLCIQSAWKRRQTRTWLRNERERQDLLIAKIEASICIQAAWRGRQHRLSSVQSLRVSPRVDIDNVHDFFNADIPDGDESIPVESNEISGDDDPSIACDEDAEILSLLTDAIDRVVGTTAVNSAKDSLPDSRTTEPSQTPHPEAGEIDGFLTTSQPPLRSMSTAFDPYFSIVSTVLNALTEMVVTTKESTLGDEDTSSVIANNGEVLRQESDSLLLDDHRHEVEKSTGNHVITARVDVAPTPTSVEVFDDVRSSLDEILAQLETATSTKESMTPGNGIEETSNFAADGQGNTEVSAKANEEETIASNTRGGEGFIESGRINASSISPDQSPFEQDEVALNSPLGSNDLERRASARTSRPDSDRSLSNDVYSDGGGSSIDSSDLMLEADAMVDMNDTAEIAAETNPSDHPKRKPKRLDSSILLADFQQLDAQSS